MLIEGKLFVVVLVLALIFVGLIVFMVMIDQRLRKIERRQDSEDRSLKTEVGRPKSEV